MTIGLAVPHVVAVGSSAGGLVALRAILSALPHDLPIAVLIVQHLSPKFASRLAGILASQSGYPVGVAKTGTAVREGMAFVAPPDQHMIIDRFGRIRLRRTDPINHVRPSVDALFCSVAPIYQARVIGVVLTGGGTDGTAGAHEIRQHGGTIIAQSEETCEHFGMPGSVIGKGDADYVVPLLEISQRIIDLTAIQNA